MLSLAVSPALCHRINSKLIDTKEIAASDAFSKTTENHPNAIHNRQRNDNSIAYVKASIPIRIFQCMQRLNILKCMKIFILQRMERTGGTYTNSGNLTADFLDQILADNGSKDIFERQYVQMDEPEINDRLLKSFQRFFKDREIKLHFIPGMVVRVVPSSNNRINMSVKRGEFLDYYIIFYI